MHVVLNVVLAA